MTDPMQIREVAGLQVPIDLVPRLTVAIRARYASALVGITDPDEIVQAALQEWARETLVEYESAAAVAPLNNTVAQTITKYDTLGKQARSKATSDAQRIKRTIDTITPIVES